jgi:prepilin-type N-terminal cleavage/methylation domain-containing protein
MISPSKARAEGSMCGQGQQQLETGFTLIEILVTLTLLALVLGLVAPMGVRSFERAEAKSEAILLQRYLLTARERAYSLGRPLSLTFEGTQVSMRFTPDPKFTQTPEPVKPLKFDYLFFQPQEIQLNELGFVSPYELTYRQGEQERVIDLRAFLNNQV